MSQFKFEFVTVLVMILGRGGGSVEFREQKNRISVQFPDCCWYGLYCCRVSVDCAKAAKHY